MSLAIRPATEHDLPAINAIYNHYVVTSTTTYDLAPLPLEDRQRWFAGRDKIHPVIVVTTLTDGAEKIVGWGSLNVFRSKPGYRFTVENSVYVHPDHQRQGIGSAIIQHQIQQAKELDLHAIVAGIGAEQTASIALHGKHGFVEVARFPEIGRKFDQWLDVVFMQRLIK
ncbi:N-acetyltransferase family protein [Lacipirellula sp.]|uniref:GNAT family N-acetyltransferase n=1 Tax=Lacipirellula sp. TaxID=2691419 RepID=UPI003D118F15